MLWFFFFAFFLFLCFYKISVLFKSPPVSNTPMPSSSSPPSLSWKYEVFLSFRGEDVRLTFVDHFYKALKDRLVRTYKDDITLPRGVSVGPALLEAIEESRLAVIIFSKNYADSSWCLEELVRIMKCWDKKGQIVIPIFYDVEPTEVKNQTGEFGKAFARITKKNFWRKLFAMQETEKNVTKFETWRKALEDAGKITGFPLKNVANGHEAAFIQIVVDDILVKLLSSNYPNIDKEFVGMGVRVEDLIRVLEIEKDDVRMVGIWGVGGIGKTTLAACVFMKIKHRFNGHCTVRNISKELSTHSLETLQAKILKALLDLEVVVSNEEEGICMIREKLHGSKVLILLDDVDDIKQLEALAGSHEWFGVGSRIIITTRDENLLQNVDHISPVTLLSQVEGNQLFRKHAFNDKKPLKDYENLSLRVVSYAAGLPLALKVLGALLKDKDEIEWRSTLDRLKDIPPKKILKQLQISYDGLEAKDKKLFLDIACFFRGRRKDYAMEIFEACGFNPDIGIRVLIQKALITINSDGEFDMHDLIQEMGHFIIRWEHPDNTEKYSRVWKREELNNMCIGDATTQIDKIEAMGYYQRPEVVPSQFFKFVSKLKKLRWIHVTTSNVTNVEGPNFLSNELRYIRWGYYPASPFPDNFQPMNLVVLRIKDSLQKNLWRSHKFLPDLKVLQLKFMNNLVSTPDFSLLPRLQTLELHQCDILEEIHPSIGNHASLKDVHVSNCLKLSSFPTIVKMETLELLEIKNCDVHLEFPDIQSNMESLVVLSLYRVGIEGLLLSIGRRCTSLISLYLSECFIKNESIIIDFDGLKHLKDFKIVGEYDRRRMPFGLFTENVFCQLAHSLQRLTLFYCHLEDEQIPSAIEEMSNLQELNLSNNNFSKLDFSFSQLTKLKLLNLRLCKRLLELPQLPSSVAIVLADDCHNLTDVGDLYADHKRLRYASFLRSNKVTGWTSLLEFMLQVENENHCVTLQLQGLEIPKMFTPGLRAGNKCTLELPENWCSDYCGFLMCAVSINGLEYKLSPTITMKQVRTGGLMGMDPEDYAIWNESAGDETTLVWYIPFDSLRETQWWDSTYKKVWFSIYHLTSCKGFGVRLVPRKGGSRPTQTSTAEITTNSSGISDREDAYTPGIQIHDNSKNYLQITPRSRW